MPDDTTVEPIRSKWMLVKQVTQTYPLSTSRLYRLMKAGTIKSFILKDRGEKGCGTRLVDRDSLDEYLSKASQNPDPWPPVRNRWKDPPTKKSKKKRSKG